MITYISNDIHNGLFILLLNSRLTLFLLIIDNDYTIAWNEETKLKTFFTSLAEQENGNT